MAYKLAGPGPTCRRCHEPRGNRDRCRNCGVQRGTKVTAFPRWLRRLARATSERSHES